jgi:hypothetical protein
VFRIEVRPTLKAVNFKSEGSKYGILRAVDSRRDYAGRP